MNPKVDPSDRKALLKQALAAVEDLQAKLDAATARSSEPIAIIGAGCRYPSGIESPDDLWRLLRDGVNAISEVPPDRWDVDKYYHPDVSVPGRMVSRWGGFLEHVDLFDASFFGISAAEASLMDPQQRLLLEVAWEALENAGHAPGTNGARAGVFVGITATDYALLAGAHRSDQTDAYVASGNTLNAAAGRLSFVLGLQGPCVALDAACSSSLVAVHLACQSLRTGESEFALAGGVNVVLRPEPAILFSKWGMLARDGRCKTFDAAADGFVRSEGCGLVVLKRLSTAIENGDRILAVIRSSAVSQNGRSSGLTVPNGPGQQAAIRTALETARVDPAEVAYVEAHGTGTPLGDPIEVEALAAEYGKRRTAANPVLIGSIKTNIGNAESAGAIAGLLKVVLALQHERIPAHLNVTQPSPQIPWDTCGLRVATEAAPWPRGDKRRVGGVNAFGFSGTNAHVILEEAPVPAAVAPAVERPRHLLPLSARTRTALAQVASRFARHLAEHPELPLADVCFTAATGRTHFAHRVALQAATREELLHALDAVVATQTGDNGDEPASAPKVAFVFTGGAQCSRLGRLLYGSYPSFKTAIDRCEHLLAPLMDRPLRSVLYAAAGEEPLIDQPQYGEPAVFALEYALATTWQAWGVQPTVVLGHGLGEYVAACVAGALSLDDALKLVAAHGRAVQSLAAGQTAVEFDGTAMAVPSRAPRLPMISSVTGSAVTADQPLDGAYWCRHLGAQADLAGPIRAAYMKGIDTFLQTGPATGAATGVARILDGTHARVLGLLAEAGEEWTRLLDVLGDLYVAGASIDWRTFDKPFPRRRVTLPTYPFQRQRYWCKPLTDAAGQPADETAAASPFDRQLADQAPGPPADARPAPPEADRPMSRFESTVAGIWVDVLKVPQVRLHDDFFELGGHSLSAAVLMRELNNAFWVNLPMRTLFEYPTVARISEVLERQMREERPVDSFNADDVLKINTDGSRPPFVFLHSAVEGDGFYCYNLARHLGPEQPMYAIAPLGLDGSDVPVTIEEMARVHLADIRRLQPHGPYYLGGYCASGVIAYEIARLLAEAGEPVPLVILIDAPIVRPDRFVRVAHRVSRLASRVLRLDPAHAVRLRALAAYRAQLVGGVLKRGPAALGRAATRETAQLGARLAARLRRSPRGAWSASGVTMERKSTLRDSLMQDRGNASFAYLPPPYRGTVLCIWAEDLRFPEVQVDPDAWRLAVPHLQTRLVPGDHLTCVTTKVAHLAAAIREGLTAARTRTEQSRSTSGAAL
jgi:acyl transferase domain-containing protein/thioesterase domain-containing protein/acyl carrier protein